MTTREARALAEIQQSTLSLQRTTLSLQRADWRLKGVTRTLCACVKRAESNRDGLREVLDELERLYPRERPTLRVVKGGDDA
jgi:hypothetical protein